ncbi:MAG: M23 family metallopeptidase, partial [Myxococcales bacterium]
LGMPLVHALRFYSNKNGREHRAYLYRPEGAPFGRYYDADGVEVEERLENGPLDHYEQVTSLLRDGRRHKGVDFKTPTGTAVKMPFDATLTRKNWNFRANGNCLEFKDTQGRRILFLHLSELPKSLAVGRHVRRGEVVAQTGNSGRSTAPHLHYQLETGSGKVLDPFDVHRTYRTRLDPAHATAFAAQKAKLDALLDQLEKGDAPVAAMPVDSTPVNAVVDAEH